MRVDLDTAVQMNIYVAVAVLVLLQAGYPITHVIGVDVARQVGAVLWPIGKMSVLPVKVVDLETIPYL